MNRIPICLILISFCFLFQTTESNELVVKTALLSFMSKLNTVTNLPPSWGWTSTSDPCTNGWKGVICDNNNTLQVQKLFLDALHFRGIFDPSTICSVPALAESLSVISLNDNGLVVENLDAISICKSLTGLYLRGNRLSGSLPDSLSSLSSLKVLDISNNQFSGTLPDLARISLEEFLAQNNEFSGVLPNFKFAGFRRFNVSSNNLNGPIPHAGSLLPNTSFLNNPELCGDPLPNKCQSESVVPSSPPQPPPPQEKKKRGNVVSRDQILMFSGYFAIALVAAFVIMFMFCRKARKRQETVIDTKKKVAVVDESYLSNPTNVVLNEYKSSAIKSSSVASVESGGVNAPTSMVVLTSIEVSGLKFEDLLMAPAELLGRGNHGNVYKVKCEDLGMNLVVKRLNDWTISRNVFQQRMKRLDQVRHPSVLSPIAFYCSKEEKLVVYEYQPNGSLFKLLHGDQMEQVFDWSSRLGLAATTAKALAFMHQELRGNSMAHGNLKSSNILLNQNMEPCISEYGLIQEHDDQASFRSDVYAFGVILLEMLTGKVAVAQNNGMDLAKWVVSVVREEWTVEVFDRRLIREGASEERMVMLLQVAIQCVNGLPVARPNIDQVAVMINTIKEEEEKSMDIPESLNF